MATSSKSVKINARKKAKEEKRTREEQIKIGRHIAQFTAAFTTATERKIHAWFDEKEQQKMRIQWDVTRHYMENPDLCHKPMIYEEEIIKLFDDIKVYGVNPIPKDISEIRKKSRLFHEMCWGVISTKYYPEISDEAIYEFGCLSDKDISLFAQSRQEKYPFPGESMLWDRNFVGSKSLIQTIMRFIGCSYPHVKLPIKNMSEEGVLREIFELNRESIYKNLMYSAVATSFPHFLEQQHRISSVDRTLMDFMFDHFSFDTLPVRKTVVSPFPRETSYYGISIELTVRFIKQKGPDMQFYGLAEFDSGKNHSRTFQELFCLDHFLTNDDINERFPLKYLEENHRHYQETVKGGDVVLYRDCVDEKAHVFQVYQKLCQMSVIFNTFLGHLPLFAETSKLEILYPPTDRD